MFNEGMVVSLLAVFFFSIHVLMLLGAISRLVLIRFNRCASFLQMRQEVNYAMDG